MTDEQDEFLKRLELAMVSLDREYGKGTVMKLDGKNIEPWPSVSTGALSLDIALGIGGLPRGRVVEIYGPESSGKSTICMSVVAEAQKKGGTCVYIDAEHALDPQYAQSLGVKLEDLLLVQPTTGEEALEVLIRLVSTGAISVAVVDSVAALIPKDELEGAMTDQQMGLQARMMGKAMRKLVSAAADTKTLVIFTNQLRMKLGVMFGNPETTPGGRALPFYASVRIDLRKVENIKDKSDGSIIGVRTKAHTVKNKMAAPHKKVEFDILYGRGVNTLGCILDLAEERGVIKRSGAWYSYEGTQIGQGRPAAIEWLASDLEEAEVIKKKVMESYG